ncbi:MAG TPA: rhodanese-like domain-containing protein [Thermoanaerobaculia bacterium]
MRRTLATIAATAATLALLTRTPAASAPALPLDRLAKAIAHEDDHVTQAELNQWLEQKKKLRLIDVRSKAEFAKSHTANAESIPMEQIARAAFDSADTIVLLSEGGAHAAQAWVILELRGFRNVYFLRNGISGRRYEPGRDGC